MQERQFIIFSLHDLLYGIDAALVREITYLPELKTIATTPKDIIGMVNWRSQLVPVMHLDLRFGKSFSGCKINDRLIIFETDTTHIAIVVTAVYEVQSLQVNSVPLDLFQGRGTGEQPFVTGMAMLDERPVICLDLEHLIREPEVLNNLDAHEANSGELNLDFFSRCFPRGRWSDLELLSDRAKKLKAIASETTIEQTIGIVPVQIGDEYIGLPLELVVDVDRLDTSLITPIPNAPDRIVGQINWRGEILPIVELATLFQQSSSNHREVVIVQVKDVMLGIAVSQILDVLDLPIDLIRSIPENVETSQHQYFQGVAKYNDERWMYLIQIEELVARQFLTIK
jgi:purine-binding chemotaxis protein CheW